MIRKILKTKLQTGTIIEGKIYKDITLGGKPFKVDKRVDGWIEIKDIKNNQKWAIFKRIPCQSGRLYLGFELSRRPFAYFIPYVKSKKNINKELLELKRRFRFLSVNWTLTGGSKTAKYYQVKTEIIDLFSFINYLKPIPVDIKEIIDKLNIQE